MDTILEHLICDFVIQTFNLPQTLQKHIYPQNQISFILAISSLESSIMCYLI